jgi:hypothetical protein
MLPAPVRRPIPPSPPISGKRSNATSRSRLCSLTATVASALASVVASSRRAPTRGLSVSRCSRRAPGSPCSCRCSSASRVRLRQRRSARRCCRRRLSQHERHLRRLRPAAALRHAHRPDDRRLASSSCAPRASLTTRSTTCRTSRSSSTLFVSHVLAVFEALLFERRVIFVSKDYLRLSHCIFAAASLLFPFQWQHIFIPILPRALLDVCCAPMPFVVGVHVSCMPQLQRMPLESTVFVDLDRNTVTDTAASAVNAVPDERRRRRRRQRAAPAPIGSDSRAADALRRAPARRARRRSCARSATTGTRSPTRS